MLNGEHQEPGWSKPLHRMAQVPCQLVAHLRLCRPLQGTRVPTWEPETGSKVIFHPPSPGDSEESKICSQHVLLLLSFLLLSMRAKAGRGLSAPTLPPAHEFSQSASLSTFRSFAPAWGPQFARRRCLPIVILFSMKMSLPLGGPVTSDVQEAQM